MTELLSRSHISIVVRVVPKITDNNKISFDDCQPYINLLDKYKIYTGIYKILYIFFKKIFVSITLKCMFIYP